jgi:hypothetical protein
MLAYVTMPNENGTSGEEIGAAIKWAQQTLIEDLRQRNEAAAKHKTNKRGPGRSDAP